MSRPLISVVIPTYDRLPTLRRVLATYERQQPRDLRFEVLVVDDGSTDGTRDFLRGCEPRRYRLRTATQPNGGPARARNRALELATGELILFTGDDVEPAPDLLLEHCRGHLELDDPGAAVLGLTRWPEGAEITATMRHIDGPGAQQFSYTNFTDGSAYDFRHFYTSNVSLRRTLLDREPSYFSTDFPAAAFEDAELAWRLAGHGLRICYRAAAVAYHHHPYDVRTFKRRQERCGEMAAVLYRKLPELKKWLGLKELEWLRLRSLAAAGDAEARHRAVAARLPAWEDRMTRLAAFYDPLDFAPVDGILRPLFSYAYSTGLARALFGDGPARRLCAALLLESFPPAVRRFRHTMDLLGLPFPAADVEAFEELGGRRA